MDNWFQLATSSKAEVPSDDSAIRIYQAGLGEITVGINTKSEANSNRFEQQFQDPSAVSSVRGLEGMGYAQADPFKG